MLTSATRGETLTPNPNECNSTLTSGTIGIIYTKNTDVQSLNLIASTFLMYFWVILYTRRPGKDEIGKIKDLQLLHVTIPCFYWLILFFSMLESMQQIS